MFYLATFSWSAFEHYLFHPSHAFVVGLWRTVYISVLAQLLGVAIGLVVELARRSRRASIRGAAHTYVWLLRGTPLLVQLVIVYSGFAELGLYSFPDVTIFGITIAGGIQAAILTLGANEGAYMAEIVRASINSIDVGQMEAAQAVGMTHGKAMRHVVLPQAFKVMIPPLGNDFNNMMKVTSLLSVIGVEEMFLVAQEQNSQSFQTFEVFLSAAIYYLALTTIWGFIQAWIESKLNVGSAREKPKLRDRLFGTAGGGDPLAPGSLRGAR
ncbi:MAG: amino acid ABC transporter permease [Gaiellaceae bacterium]